MLEWMVLDVYTGCLSWMRCWLRHVAPWTFLLVHSSRLNAFNSSINRRVTHSGHLKISHGSIAAPLQFWPDHAITWLSFTHSLRTYVSSQSDLISGERIGSLVSLSVGRSPVVCTHPRRHHSIHHRPPIDILTLSFLSRRWFFAGTDHFGFLPGATLCAVKELLYSAKKLTLNTLTDMHV